MLKIVDVELRNVEILVAAGRHRVDVVVATLEPSPRIPPLVTHLLAEFPRMKVVGIDAADQCARVYRDGCRVRTISCVTAEELIRAIIEDA